MKLNNLNISLFLFISALQSTVLYVILTSRFYKMLNLKFEKEEVYVPLRVGDEVVYHGAYNQHVEVSTGKIVELGNNNLFRVQLYRICSDDGLMVNQKGEVWAHRMQLVFIDSTEESCLS